jgi:hypothetical protein
MTANWKANMDSELPLLADRTHSVPRRFQPRPPRTRPDDLRRILTGSRRARPRATGTTELDDIGNVVVGFRTKAPS